VVSPTYVYGIAEHAPATRGKGVAGANVLAIEHGGLTAIASPVSSSRLRAKRRDVMAHQEVLQHVFAETTVLPLRFGTVFESSDAVVDDLLAPRHDALLRMLRRLDGLVELGVRAYYVENAVLEEIVREDPRVARMRGTGATVALGEAVVGALDAKRGAESRAIERRLARIAESVVAEPPRTDYELFRGAFLVRRARVGEFDAAMDELARPRAGTVVFKYVGPLPPHSFVDPEGAG
jgi:hypothetical protein